jgi:hypothetical protein
MSDQTLTGWGRGTWGEAGWGTSLPVEPTGLGATLSVGSVTVVAKANVVPTGQAATASTGSIQIVAKAITQISRVNQCLRRDRHVANA